MKIVIDSNVIIAAYATRGLCNALMEYCLEKEQIIICSEVLNEVKIRLKSKIKIPENLINEIISFIISQVEIVKPETVDLSICRDKNDLMVLGTALAGKAQYIIAGDKDLLSIKKIKGIEIVNPRSFWTITKDS